MSKNFFPAAKIFLRRVHRSEKNFSPAEVATGTNVKKIKIARHITDRLKFCGQRRHLRIICEKFPFCLRNNPDEKTPHILTTARGFCFGVDNPKRLC